MNKRYEDLFQKLIYKGEKIPFSFGTLAVVAFCVLLIIISTFVRIEIVHPWLIKNPSGDFEVLMKSYPYIPQIPILLGIVALLGKEYGLITIGIYIFMGLFVWPVFGMGGGIGYFKSAFFGYILGFIPAVILSGNILNKGIHIKYTSLASVLGILAMDLTGIFYILLLAIFRVIDLPALKLAFSAFNVSYILYSITCSIIAIYIGIGMKYVLWPVMQTDLKVKKFDNIKKQIIKKMEMQEPDEFEIELSKKPKKRKVKKVKEAENTSPKPKRGRPKKLKEDI